MSKAFLRAEASGTVSLFSKLLPSIDPSSDPEYRKSRLGRTAEGLLKLREEARTEGREDGFSEGFEAGKDEGIQAARQEMAEEVEAFRTALDEAANRVDEAMAAWYEVSEQSLSELSASIAARILARELEISKDAITELVRTAVKEVASADRLRIRVHPFDVKVLEANRSLVLSANPTIRSVEIVEDPNISGGARIESDAGAIDATLRTQIEMALQAIRGPKG